MVLLGPSGIVHLTNIVKQAARPNVETDVLPVLRKQNGFKDEITFLAGDRAEAVAISLWDRKENADNYSRDTYPEVLKTLAKVLEGTPKVENYEVCELDIPQDRRAQVGPGLSKSQRSVQRSGGRPSPPSFSAGHDAGWLRSTPLSTQRSWTASSHLSPRENVSSPSPIRLGNAESSRLGGAVRRRATRLCVGGGTRSGSHDQVEPHRGGLRSEFRCAGPDVRCSTVLCLRSQLTPRRRGWLEPS